MHNVFVYGTLRNDYEGYMANYLRSNAKFVGRKKLNNYSLYDLGSFPCISHDPGSFCYGHLFSDVPDEVMDRLDAYEGYPDHYNRVKVDIDGIETFVYTYDYPPAFKDKIEEWVR